MAATSSARTEGNNVVFVEVLRRIKCNYNSVCNVKQVENLLNAATETPPPVALQVRVLMTAGSVASI